MYVYRHTHICTRGYKCADTGLRTDDSEASKLQFPGMDPTSLYSGSSLLPAPTTNAPRSAQILLAVYEGLTEPYAQNLPQQITPKHRIPQQGTGVDWKFYWVDIPTTVGPSTSIRS